MKLRQHNADIHLPVAGDIESALARTTHLAIGAHQDDLEFMAFEGILHCHGRDDRWFSGITCTDGSGSARTGPYASFSDAELAAERIREQRQAADLGQYACMVQLGYPSRDIKDPARDGPVDDLAALLRAAGPEVLYTHNPIDRHPTHLAVFARVLAALRRLPVECHPRRFIGCEGWRDLDWLPRKWRIEMDLSGHSELARQLNTVFASQIAGGKRYDRAIMGRRLAHATLGDSHSVDTATEVCLGMDLMPLLDNPVLHPAAFVADIIRTFQREVDQQLQAVCP